MFGDDSVLFIYTDKSGAKSVSTSVDVDAKDNTVEISLGVEWSSQMTEGYGSKESIRARFAVPPEDIAEAFADGVVSVPELRGIVGRRDGLLGASTHQTTIDPSRAEGEESTHRWMHYVQPGGYEWPGAVTEGLKSLYKNVEDEWLGKR